MASLQSSNEKQHHNPDGMITLCATHASLADDGRWTKEQFIEMKRNPYLTIEKISETYGYLRKRVVCIIGNVAYGVQDVLQIDEERVIGFEGDNEGYDRLNVLVRDKDKQPILVMENNFWTASSRELYELRFPPSLKPDASRDNIRGS